jgi:transcriptional/translational regulatory protein YebC/TACO1
MGVFRLNPEGIDHDDLELYLIDHGLEEMGDSTGDKGEPQIVARCLFADFGQMQEALEKRGIAPISATHEYICTAPVELPEAKANEALAMIDKLEQDEDVQNVYHSARLVRVLDIRAGVHASRATRRQRAPGTPKTWPRRFEPQLSNR